MEQFFIDRNELMEMDAHINNGGVPHCFRLVVAQPQELKEQLPKILGTEIEISEEWYKARSAPFIEHIGHMIHYVCFTDMNDHGQETGVRFFLAENTFVLENWGNLSPKSIAAWAKRDMLKEPLDIALNLGYSVLRNHQSRLESIENDMDHLEVEILKGSRVWQQARIIELHRKVLGLKKSLNLHQSVFTRLAEFQASTGLSLWRDLVSDTQRELDNARQTHELVENLREAYQAAVDNRSNDIMKLLTLMATILLPINLLTSFFGMNFRSMPLLDKSYGLMVFYGLSVIIAALAFWYFWRRRWLK